MEFRELLEEHGIDTAPAGHDHNTAGWINFDCPWCSPGWVHYRMGYNIRGRFVNCWACGRHELVSTVTELLGKSTGVVSRLLRDIPEGQKVDKVPRGKLELPHGLFPLMLPHRKYLKHRGFDWLTIRRLWEIKGIGISADGLSWSIFIPIFYNGVMVSWTTRSLHDEHKGRYIAAKPNQEAIDHRTLLYGEDYVRHAAICCEGPTDVWRIGPGAVCTFGTGFSGGQVVRLAKFPVRVVCYDSELAAQRRARELCNQLEVLPGETYNVVLNAKDPGSASDEEVKELRERFL